MSYYQLRVTLDASSNATPDRVQHRLLQLKKWLNKRDDGDDFTSSGGYELFNKYGEPCDPHYHFNFYYDHPTAINVERELKRQVKTQFAKVNIILRGNSGPSSFSLTRQEVEDPIRWFRYPLKETPVRSLCHIGGTFETMLNDSFDQQLHNSPDHNAYLTILEDLAKDERKRSVLSNISHREKLRSKSTFKDKLFIHLDTLPVPPPHQLIWIETLKYYSSQDKPLNFETISGYTKLYQVQKGYVSPEAAYSTLYNNLV